MSAWLLSALLALAPQVDSAAPPPAAANGGTDVQVTATLVADALPERDVSELRPALSVRVLAYPRPWLAYALDGGIEGLVADRTGRIATGAIRLRDVWIEARGRRADLRGGYGSVVWGRLDELSPSDVINPVDTARFLFEGRSEARLPVTFVRGRLLPSDALTIEAVLVPLFRRGTFDLLDEPTSPFNPVRDAVLPAGVELAFADRAHIDPPRSWSNVSGGGRLQATLARVDLSVSAFRGFDPVGPIVFDLTPGLVRGREEPFIVTAPAVVGRLVEHHPRFTMIAADLETVTGAWAWRAELAVFPERTFAESAGPPTAAATLALLAGPPGLVSGRSFDAGLGADRRAGSWRVFTSVLVHHEESDGGCRTAGPCHERTDVNVVGSLERTFAQDRYRARVFLVANPPERSTFLRGLMAWQARDPLALELSAGWFSGRSEDPIGRFDDRDFVVARLRYDF